MFRISGYLFLVVLILLNACSGKFDYRTLGSGQGESESLISDEQYVSGSSDIPLFSGLKIIDDQSANFDTVSGNIVISTYSSDARLSEVKYFYLGALPQLGWQLDSESGDNISYKRNSDLLEISFKKQQNKLLVKFFISSSI